MKTDPSHDADRYNRELMDAIDEEMALEEAGVIELYRNFGKSEDKMSMREEAKMAYEKRKWELEEQVAQAERANQVREREHLLWRAVLFLDLLSDVKPSRELPAREQLEALRRTMDFEIQGKHLVWEALHFECGSNLMRIVEPCPECEGRLYSKEIESMADIGEWLAGGGRQWHNHYFEDDSTHPNRPIQPFAFEITTKASQTAEERLCAALREIIEERLG